MSNTRHEKRWLNFLWSSRPIACLQRLAAILIAFEMLLGSALAGPFEDVTAAYNSGDYSVAVRLFEAMARRGNAEAQYNLGVIYFNGRGIPQDYVRAHMWFNLAAAHGDEDASGSWR